MSVKLGEEIVYPESELIDSRYLPRRAIVYQLEMKPNGADCRTARRKEPGSEDASVDVWKMLYNVQSSSFLAVWQKSTQQNWQYGIPPFWLMRTERMSIITLCGLSKSDLVSENKLLKYVIEALGIQSITGFSLRFRLHSALSPLDEYKNSPNLQRGVCVKAPTICFTLTYPALKLSRHYSKNLTGSFELYRVLEKISQRDETGTDFAASQCFSATQVPAENRRWPTRRKYHSQLVARTG